MKQQLAIYSLCAALATIVPQVQAQDATDMLATRLIQLRGQVDEIETQLNSGAITAHRAFNRLCSEVRQSYGHAMCQLLQLYYSVRLQIGKIREFPYNFYSQQMTGA